MRTWMSVWLFPLWLIGALVLLTLGSPAGGGLALLWAFVLVPHVAATILRRSPDGADQARDRETNYWRTGLR